MTVWTIGELMQLTRVELCAIAINIENALPALGTGTVDRFNALVSLENIRCVMVMRDFRY